MTHALLIFWLISTILIIREYRVARILIYLVIFSLVASLCYLMLGSPDVAMAEAATSAFTVLFFIVCFEKYFSFSDDIMGAGETETTRRKFFSVESLIPFGITACIFALFLKFRPYAYGNTYLRDRYLESFVRDVGGENPVTAIYLGYRVYDTLFEALVVVICVVAAIHLSAFGENTKAPERRSEMEGSAMAAFAIQIICALMLLFGIYLVLNGHITPGGGFQGGLAISSFFICRYMIYNVNDLPIKKLSRMEELVFIAIALFAISIVFLGAAENLPDQFRPVFQVAYMLVMNILIALKVACGFIILFYRYIVMEQL